MRLKLLPKQKNQFEVESWMERREKRSKNIEIGFWYSNRFVVHMLDFFDLPHQKLWWVPNPSSPKMNAMEMIPEFVVVFWEVWKRREASWWTQKSGSKRQASSTLCLRNPLSEETARLWITQLYTATSTKVIQLECRINFKKIDIYSSQCFSWRRSWSPVWIATASRERVRIESLATSTFSRDVSVSGRTCRASVASSSSSTPSTSSIGRGGRRTRETIVVMKSRRSQTTCDRLQLLEGWYDREFRGLYVNDSRESFLRFWIPKRSRKSSVNTCKKREDEIES